MLCINEETFGPLLPITTIKTEEEAIERANNTPFTENISRAIPISERLEYGIVRINDGSPSTPQAPFGGFKESSLGREGGYYGIEEFLETKYVSLAL